MNTPVTGGTATADTARLIGRLRRQLVPAALTPMDEHGTVDYAATEAYATGLADSGAAGIGVWAHTGRGLHLAEADRVRVLATFRQATALPIIAGAGVPVGADGDYRDETVKMAVQAATCGADAIMVYPPVALRVHPDRDALILDLHQRVAAAVDRPLLGFYLHDEAGGYEYPPSLVRDLLAIPTLAGIKVATLDRAMACQDTILAITEQSDRLAITGEDRMYGPSLMWGADSALVGMAAAEVELSLAPLKAWFDGDLAAFHRASHRLDRFAAATFRAPIEGYLQRMHWLAVREGLIPPEAAFDPYGPKLPASDRREVLDWERGTKW